MTGPKRLSWVEESQQAMFIVMEMSWLCSVFFFLDGLTGRWPGLVLFWTPVLYVPAYIGGRLARVRSWSGARWKALMVLGILSSLAAGIWVLLPEVRPLGGADGLVSWAVQLVKSKENIYPVLVIVLGGGYVWVRGWHLAGRQTRGRDFVTGFQMGFAILLCNLFLCTWLDPPLIPAAGLIAAFLAAGLIGLGLARLLSLSALSTRAQAGPWLLIMGAAVGLVLAAGVAAWLLMDRDLVTLLSRPLVWLWERFMDLIRWLASLVEPRPLPDLPLSLPDIPLPDQVQERTRVDLSWIKTVGKVLFYSSTLFLLMGALFGFLKDVMLWLRRRLGDQYLVAVESVEGGFWGDLRTSALLMWRMVKDWYQRAAAWVRPSKSPQNDAEAVKAVYRRLLKWGAARGSPKGRHQTPGEYLETLRPLVPEKSRPLEMITECYIQVRYGPDPLAPGALDRIREDWRRLKARRKRRPSGPEHKI